MCVKEDKKVAALILAAGMGSRMNMPVTKQRLSLCGKSVLLRSVEAHMASRLVDTVTVVCRGDEVDFVRAELAFLNEKPTYIVIGGKTRAESARLGFESIDDDVDYVSIHDGARCLVTREMIDKVILAAFEYGAATAATPITDTVKLTDSDGKIKSTVPRENLWAAATPQAFSRELYQRALLSNDTLCETVTDDNILLERLGVFPVCVDTGKENMKITTPEDLALAEFLIQRRTCEV